MEQQWRADVVASAARVHELLALIDIHNSTTPTPAAAPTVESGGEVEMHRSAGLLESSFQSVDLRDALDTPPSEPTDSTAAQSEPEDVQAAQHNSELAWLARELSRLGITARLAEVK